MKYDKIYNKLIEKRKLEIVSENYHRHHIIPKCLGGDDNLDNIVKLYYREHLVAHKLLVKMHTGKNKKKMIYALWKMMYSYKSNILFQISSREYEKSRILYSKNNPNKTPALREKLSKRNKSKEYRKVYEAAGKTLSETLQKLSKEELQMRMKNSVGKGNQEQRALSIRKGKSSKVLITFPDKSSIELFSFELFKYNLKMNRIRYCVKRHNGHDSNNQCFYQITDDYEIRRKQCQMK